jgi:hypothetical protein
MLLRTKMPTTALDSGIKKEEAVVYDNDIKTDDAVVYCSNDDEDVWANMTVTGKPDMKRRDKNFDETPMPKKRTKVAQNSRKRQIAKPEDQSSRPSAPSTEAKGIKEKKLKKDVLKEKQRKRKQQPAAAGEQSSKRKRVVALSA